MTTTDDKPTTEAEAADPPASAEPATEPATAEPVADKPDDEAAAAKPAKKPAEPKPADDDAAARKPAKKPAAKKPAARQPGAKKPGAKKPAARQPIEEPDPYAARLMEHEYDGIREYDNPLPFWWSGLFILTILHAGWYFFWYHLGGPGKSPQQEYAADLAAYEAKRAAAPVEEVELDEETLKSLAADPATVAQGKAVFVKNCTSCHTENGRGLVGPNLTDDYQIHGTNRIDIFHTIRDGVPEKGMISWGPILPRDELTAVAAFVVTLRDTNVAGGKAPDGAPVQPFQ